MNPFRIAITLFALSFAGCAGTQIGSIGVGGSYQNESGQTFSGNVNIGLKDAKTVKPIK